MRINLGIVKNLVTTAVVSVIAGILLLWCDSQRIHVILDSTKQTIRLELKELYSAVEIGMSSKEAEEIIREFVNVNRGYRFLKDEIDNSLELQAPDGFFRTTIWSIYIVIDNSVVVGTAIRPMEGNFRLCSAPDDRGNIPELLQIHSAEDCIDDY